MTLSRFILTGWVVLSLIVTLSGCKTVPVATPPVEAVAQADVTTRCPDLDHIDQPATLGVAMKYITKLQTDYIDCAIRSDAKNEALNKPKK